MKLKIRVFLVIVLLSFLVVMVVQVWVELVCEFVLVNGMKVVVKEDWCVFMVVQMVWYKVGGIDEFNGIIGVLYVLEYMMFKGIKNYKVGEFSCLVVELGGQENVFIVNDFIVYFQQIEKSYLEKVMVFEVDCMVNL